MNRKKILLAALPAVLLMTVFTMFPSHLVNAQTAAVAAAKAKPTPTPTPIPASSPVGTFYDFDSSGTTLMLLRGDDTNGTQATYASSSSGGSSLVSSFVNGEWNLNLSNQTLRTLYITPNVAIDGLQPQGPPAGYYSQGVTSRTGCFDQNGNTVPLANVVTTSGNCKLGINFDSGGTSYKLLMSPFPLSGSGDPVPTCPSTGCPATGAVTVTCNVVSNGQCVNWTIEPNGTAPNANVANLYRFSSAKGKTTLVFIGQYYNSFRIYVSNQ